MPRRSVLTPAQKVALLALPSSKLDFERYYTFTSNEIFIINQKRGLHNRIGFALMLCLIRYPGITYDADTVVEYNMMQFIKNQLSIQNEIDMSLYFKRETTRREHLVEIQNLFGYRSFGAKMYENYLETLLPTAKATDNGLLVAHKLVQLLRDDMIILPSFSVIERVCAETITTGTKWVYEQLLESFTKQHLESLQKLFEIKSGTNISYLGWLQERHFVANPKYILEQIEPLADSRKQPII